MEIIMGTKKPTHAEKDRMIDCQEKAMATLTEELTASKKREAAAIASNQKLTGFVQTYGNIIHKLQEYLEERSECLVENAESLIRSEAYINGMLTPLFRDMADNEREDIDTLFEFVGMSKTMIGTLHSDLERLTYNSNPQG